MASKYNEGKGELSVAEEDDEMAAPEEAELDDAEVQESAGQRSATATVVAGLGLAASVVSGIMSALGSVNRKIVISLANNTGHPLTAISIYFFSGTADQGLPGTIQHEHTLGFGARKTRSSLRGTVGVLTYHIAATNQTAALMWSVPFDYNLYSNWWNFEVRPGRVAASRELYQSLYYSDTAIKGDSNHHWLSSNGWKFEGSMAHSGTPELRVKLG